MMRMPVLCLGNFRLLEVRYKYPACEPFYEERLK